MITKLEQNKKHRENQRVNYLIRINKRVEERIREHGNGSYMCVWFKEDEDTAADSDIYKDYIHGQTDS